VGQIQEDTKSSIVIEKKDGKTNIILDASKIDLFQLCEMRYNIRYNLRRTLPANQRNSSLDMGTLGHVGMEIYYSLLKEGKHYNDRMHSTLLKIRSFASDPDQSNTNPDEISLICNAVEQSCDYWRGEDEMMIIIAVETPFAYVLYEDEHIRIIISGKIDLLVNKPAFARNAGYENLPIDHKTQSRNFDAPRLSNQFINYCAATGSNYLFVNKIGLQKTLTPEQKFARVPFSYDPFIIQDWKDNITKMILGRYLECIATDEWTMNFTSCLKFNRLCEYYEVCDSSGQEAKLFKLENNYIEAEEWDVTKGLMNG